jgi:Rps23 Pro-64 3,4-dihydroxylase Tpa1-like proline 4-hydroxylase
VSVYHQGHFFRLHQDRTDGPAASRRYGVIYYFDFPPRRFHGGELVLYDVDQESQLPTASFTTIEPTANMLAVIPAGAWHEVLPIVCQSDDWYAGRFTLSGWIHDEDDPVG